MNKFRFAVLLTLLLGSSFQAGLAQEKKKLDRAESSSRTSSPLQFWLKARHILVSHKDADQSRHSRSQARAKTRATRIHQLVLALSKDIDVSKSFAELARKVSDSPDKESGGQLPPFRLQNLELAAATALEKLSPGTPSAPIETRFGFHIFLREKVLEFGLEQKLFRFKGAKKCPESESRSEKQAKADAEKELKNLKRDEDFEGELLGMVVPSLLAKEIASVLIKLKAGQVHQGIIRTDYGFHIIRRRSIDLAQAQHILIDHDLGFQSVSLRTKAEAKKVANDLLRDLKKNPKLFSELAKKHSADQRISLGTVPREGPQALPAIQKALFQVKVGQLVGEVLESRYGFHIVLRVG